MFESKGYAIPAFARREGVSCVTCHTNGSAPRLTRYGYEYRRAGFRDPDQIGKVEVDEKAMTIGSHMSANINIDYEYVTEKPVGGSEGVTSNQFNSPGFALWPANGGFMGNFGTWVEVDMNFGTTGGAGSASLSTGDVRYVTGSADFFFSIRSGVLAGEGFGASDQWLDDANVPLIDSENANYNQDTLALPLGPMTMSQLGTEFGLTSHNTNLTFGIYNGLDGAANGGSGTAATVQPALMHKNKDTKFQLDQFIGDRAAITAIYYDGYIPLLDPTNTTLWNSHYSLARLYGTLSITRSIDLMLGSQYGWFDYVSSSGNGNFNNRGGFIGATWAVSDKLTLASRIDYINYNLSSSQGTPKANGFSVQASVPVNKTSIFVARLNNTSSDLTGVTDDARVEWRFLF